MSLLAVFYRMTLDTSCMRWNKHDKTHLAWVFIFANQRPDQTDTEKPSNLPPLCAQFSSCFHDSNSKSQQLFNRIIIEIGLDSIILREPAELRLFFSLWRSTWIIVLKKSAHIRETDNFNPIIETIIHIGRSDFFSWSFVIVIASVASLSAAQQLSISFNSLFTSYCKQIRWVSRLWSLISVLNNKEDH